MNETCKNIFQAARESAGITQEKAAEAIGISIDSIRKYESMTTPRVPPKEVVDRMISIYNTLYLKYQFYDLMDDKSNCLPAVEVKPLPNAALSFLKEFGDIDRLKESIICIAANGKVDDEQQLEWKKIEKEISELCGAGLSLTFAQENKKDGEKDGGKTLSQN